MQPRILIEGKERAGIIAHGKSRSMMVLKWLLTVVIALLVLGLATPWLRRIGLGRMPGDIEVERNGRRYAFPIGSTVMLSLLASLLYWMLR